MQVKVVERTANVAWSPKNVQPIYLAAGTAAQQLDASFSTSAAIEVYNLNLNDTANELSLVTSLPSEQRFHKLAWGSDSSSLGTIVGGCDGGLIQIYNVAKLLKNEESGTKFQKHTGAVRAIDFNPYQNNLFASGAAESEIFIWNLNNLSAPMSPGSKVQPPEDLTDLAWNNQVQHILATVFASRCAIWDLRKNDPIIKLTDTSCRLRWSSVAWNPEVATQLCLASEDAQFPFIQLWDLRFATSPAKVLEGHRQGALSVSWCHQDTEMLLSCGKDNRVLCWNPNSQGGELICEMYSPSQWNFDVAWCPRNPALFSTCSFDGHVSVSSLVGGPQQPQTSTKIADSFPGMELYAQAAPPTQVHTTPVDLRKPPKWLKRPSTARFGFGGKLVVMENRTITVCQVTSEPGVVARANLLDGALRNDNCSEYCRGKVAASTEDDEKTLWQFILASFTPTPKEEYLNLLGFHRQDVATKLSQLQLRSGNAERLATLGRSTDTESEFDVSDEITDPRSSLFGTGDVQASPARSVIGQGSRSARSYKISTTDDMDGLICEALLLGDIEAAVELCVEDARWADAIILAMTGGSDLLAKTQHRYLQENPGCLSKLVAAAVTEDWSPVVENCDVSSWKEALVAALTHTTEDYPSLCESLGRRLNPRLAQLCFLCSGNIDNLVSAWLSVNKASSPDSLQDLVEIIMLLKRSMELRGRSVTLSGQIAELLSRYGVILASEGYLEMALSYLENSQDEGVVFLRDRIYRAAGLGGPQYEKPVQQQQQQQQQQPAQRTRPAAYQSNQSAGYQSQSNTYGGYQNSQNTYSQSNIYAPVPNQSAAAPLPPPPTGVQEPSFNLNPTNQRQGSPSGGLPSRTKHVLDPSVASGPTGYNPSPAPYNFQNSTPAQIPYGQPPANQTPYTSNQQPMSAPFTPYNSAPPAGPPPMQQQPKQQQQPAPPPGWNDPPPINTSRAPVTEMSAQHAGTRKWREMIQHSHDVVQQPKKEVVQQAPITTPLIGGPQPPVNGHQQMYDPYQQNRYQPNNPQPLNNLPPPPAANSFASPQPTNSYGPPPPVNNFGPPPPASSFAPPPPPAASFAPPPVAGSFPPPPPPTNTLASSQPPNMFQPQSNAFPPPPPPSQTPNSFLPPPPASVTQSQNSFGPPPTASTGYPSNSYPPAPTPPTQISRPPSQPSFSPFAPLQQTQAFPPPPPPTATQTSRPPSQQSFSAPQQNQQFQPPTPAYGAPQSYPNPNQQDQSMGYARPPQSQQQPPQQAVTKKAIPEEHMHLRTVLEELKNKSIAAATNPQSKRKLDDVSRKLDTLYDNLADGKLSPNTLQTLHAIAQRVQNGDYTGGLTLHTQLVSGPDFAQIAPFMPGVKVLLQTALQLQVYL